MNHYYLLCLGLVVAPLLSAEESTLVIPHSPQEMRKFMGGNDSRCPGCGVVSSVRQIDPKNRAGNDDDEEASLARFGDSGPGDDVETVTIVGTGSQSREARREAAKPVARPWLITVRYDDGSYAAFEQDTAPAVRKGDRVQVVSGRVERR
jgi:hypothetical protein